MKVTFSKLTLAAIFALALAFTISCAEKGGDKKCAEIFNPDNSFCYDGVVYDKCDGMKYNPSTHICTGKTATRAKCNEVEYNPSTQICVGQTVRTRLDPLTDSRDGKTYKTVEIGSQIWMAENLNYDADLLDSKCYENKQGNCAKYGMLYNWKTAMKSCPKGWHLPSKEEWQALVDLAGGNKIAGKKLKAKSGWNKNYHGMDDYGFSALPGGSRLGTIVYGTSFGGAGSAGNWWSSTEYDSNDAYYWSMGYDLEHANCRNYSKTSLFSVRCLQD